GWDDPMPTGAEHTLYVLEGATDAIAAHGIGLVAAGRPSCTGGVRHIVTLVRSRKPNRIVIVADNDTPGMQGADSLAATLALHCRDVRVITPPTGRKDLRDWVGAGATRTDVEQLSRSSASQRPTIRLNPLTLTATPRRKP